MSQPAQHGSKNTGIQHFGSGALNVIGSAVGDHALTVNSAQPQPAGTPAATPRHTGWDIGILTVLAEETRAVNAMLNAAGTCRKNLRANSGIGRPGVGQRWCPFGPAVRTDLMAAGRTAALLPLPGSVAMASCGSVRAKSCERGSVRTSVVMA
jgi:hypothetical protein